MKRILFSLLILAIAATAYSKEISKDKIPVLIEDKFYKDFPHAEIVKWEVTMENLYKVEFWEENYYITAFYDPDGEFLESVLIIDWLNLPPEGRKRIHSLGKHRIINVLRIANFHNEVYYQIDYSRNFKRHQLLLDENGKEI